MGLRSLISWLHCDSLPLHCLWNVMRSFLLWFAPVSLWSNIFQITKSLINSTLSIFSYARCSISLIYCLNKMKTVFWWFHICLLIIIFRVPLFRLCCHLFRLHYQGRNLGCDSILMLRLHWVPFHCDSLFGYIKTWVIASFWLYIQWFIITVLVNT